MSGSGHESRQLDGRKDRLDSSGAHVAQLRRLVWLLLVWASFLTMVLAASISLHFILPRPSSNTTVPGSSNHPILSTFDYHGFTRSSSGSFELRWRNNTHQNIILEVEQDGTYFIFLQVTLEEPHSDVSYVFVSKEHDQKHVLDILGGHINGSQLSTGFMGKGFRLPEGTILKVTCNCTADVNYKNTYLGLIKLS